MRRSTCFRKIIMDPLGSLDSPQEEEEEREEDKDEERGKERKKPEEEEQEEEEEARTNTKERELKGLLRKLMTFQDNLNDRLKESERPSKEILAAVEREVQDDLENAKVLIGEGAGKCFSDLERRDFLSFVRYYLCVTNEKVLKICQGIMAVLIYEDTAQQIFDLICKFHNGPSLPLSNYIAYCNALKLCNDKSACPTTDNIKALLTWKTFSASEVLFAFLQLMEQLIKTHRNHGNPDPIEVYLNPMQDFYKVSEDVRSAAGRVIRSAYCTLSNCLESGSLINTLLFLDSGTNDDDDAVIKEWFEKADFPLRGQIMKKEPKSTRELEDELSRRNDNCLQRSVLHLVAIFVHNDQVLNLIPKEFIEKAKDGRDLHGCTPLHIAYLHGNQSVILLLESYHANAIADYFGRTPESFRVPYEYSEDNHTEYCRKITATKSSVFAVMKKMLILPVNECEAIEDNFKVLFEMMVSQDGLLNATVKIAGSVREKLKVGRLNEVDVQIRLESKPLYSGGPFPNFNLHEHLVKRMAEIDWSLISLRPVSIVFDAPWKFIWEREGTYNGLVISVDVVPMVINHQVGGLREDQPENLNYVLKHAPLHESLKFLKGFLFNLCMHTTSLCEHEWDILDNLLAGCRLGILIAKAMLEVLDQVSDNDRAFKKAPITSYMIKNTVFCILAGKTPQYPKNVIGERYGHLKQQLDFKGTIPTWTTEEDLESHAEEGRLWAETIFDAIHFMAKNCEKVLRSFLIDDIIHISPDKLYDVLHTCERCLELLRPCVFFNEKRIN